MSILVLLATAVAAAVEWVEALTIVLAVGLFKGWKAAFVGLALGLLALVALVAVFGVTITSHVSIEAARTLVGVFLLLFGLKWLHKAILRSSGLKSLHDEAKTFEETKEMLVASGTSRAGSTESASPPHSAGSFSKASKWYSSLLRWAVCRTFPPRPSARLRHCSSWPSPASCSVIHSPKSRRTP